MRWDDDEDFNDEGIDEYNCNDDGIDDVASKDDGIEDDHCIDGDLKEEEELEIGWNLLKCGTNLSNVKFTLTMTTISYRRRS